LSQLSRQGGALLIGLLFSFIAAPHAASAQTSSLPSGWTHGDIGGPVVAGNATMSAGMITVTGAGTDVSGTSDEFHYAYQQISGDVDIRVRVASLQNVDPGDKAGLMIREALTDNARHAFMFVSGGQGLAFQRRTKTGRASVQTTAAGMAAPVWLRLVRQGNVFNAYSSPTGATWTLLGSARFGMNTNVYVGLAVTSHVPSLTAAAAFTGLDLGSSASLPTPWVAGDVGNAALAGVASASGGTFTVTGAGQDIGDTSDQFQFVYQPVTGDTQIVAWVASLQAVDGLSKAGVMIREGLTGPSANASMLATGSSGWAFQRRLSGAGSTYGTAGTSGAAPGWVRLVREGDLFSAYQSQDGSQWTLVGSDTIVMPATVYVGLAVTSHNVAALATATFSNVTVGAPASSNKPPTVSISAPIAGASYTAPASMPLSAIAGDVDGSVTRVDFYAGTQLVASAGASPFTATWSNVAAGTYSLTAVATDNAGATTTSQPVAVTVTAGANKPPTVSITAPTAGASYTAPASIGMSAMAGDADGSVTRVDFYAGTQLVGSATTNPFAATWTNVAAGTYSLTAVATDNAGATATSQPVSVTVGAANKPPTVSLSAPATGATYTAPASITISATAADTDGSVARVDFYAGTQLVGSDTSSPYSVTWGGVAVGSYTLKAVATDNAGVTATSQAVSVTVAANKPPTVSLSAPATGATYTAPASITISATAADTDGAIARVDFYAGTQLVGSDASSPFSVTWASVAAGTYNLTAVASDNLGMTGTSMPVSVTVTPVTMIPTTLIFGAPTDYATNVTSMTVELRRSVDGSTVTPVATKNLGKPAAVSGDITVDISSIVDPLPAGAYYAIVVTIGPGGSTSSSPSAVFSK
jgi:regulation of enolase protein 1 (concanavalin A-like superfamily)